MKIYIEYAILDNLIINTLLLVLLCRLFKEKASLLKVFLASMLGTIVAILLPLLNSSIILNLSLKIALGLVMVLIVFDKAKFKGIVNRFLVFLGLTFALGGSIYGVFAAFGISVDSLALNGYNFAVPISLLVLTAAMFFAASFKIIKLLFKYTKQKELVFNLTISGLSLTGYYDTGNTIKDENGKPVCLIDRETFSKLTIYNNLRFLKIGSAVGEEEIPVFDLEEMYIFDGAKTQKLSSICFGVCDKNFGKFNILLNKDCLCNLK